MGRIVTIDHIRIALARIKLDVEIFLLGSGEEFGEPNSLKDEAIHLMREALKAVEDANI